MTFVLDKLGRTDAFRFGALAPSPLNLPRKEWHHFIVHGDDGRLIVNFSLTDRELTLGSTPVARVIVLVDHGDWKGWVEEYEEDEECEDEYEEV